MVLFALLFWFKKFTYFSSPEDGLTAALSGAHRIELCSALDQDGLSPTVDDVAKTLELVSLPLKVMVRPRAGMLSTRSVLHSQCCSHAGDFLHTPDEFETMLQTLHAFQALPVHGVVFGLLSNVDNSLRVDRQRTKQFVEAAKPLKTTFHKAIDLVAPENLVDDVLWLASIGVDEVQFTV